MIVKQNGAQDFIDFITLESGTIETMQFVITCTVSVRPTS